LAAGSCFGFEHLSKPSIQLVGEIPESFGQFEENPKSRKFWSSAAPLRITEAGFLKAARIGRKCLRHVVMASRNCQEALSSRLAPSAARVTFRVRAESEAVSRNPRALGDISSSAIHRRYPSGRLPLKRLQQSAHIRLEDNLIPATSRAAIFPANARGRGLQAVQRMHGYTNA